MTLPSIVIRILIKSSSEPHEQLRTRLLLPPSNKRRRIPPSPSAALRRRSRSSLTEGATSAAWAQQQQMDARKEPAAASAELDTLHHANLPCRVPSCSSASAWDLLLMCPRNLGLICNRNNVTSSAPHHQITSSMCYWPLPLDESSHHLAVLPSCRLAGPRTGMHWMTRSSPRIRAPQGPGLPRARRRGHSSSILSSAAATSLARRAQCQRDTTSRGPVSPAAPAQRL
jgi:hypothetical protein